MIAVGHKRNKREINTNSENVQPAATSVVPIERAQWQPHELAGPSFSSTSQRTHCVARLPQFTMALVVDMANQNADSRVIAFINFKKTQRLSNQQKRQAQHPSKHHEAFFSRIGFDACSGRRRHATRFANASAPTNRQVRCLQRPPRRYDNIMLTSLVFQSPTLSTHQLLIDDRQCTLICCGTSETALAMILEIFGIVADTMILI